MKITSIIFWHPDAKHVLPEKFQGEGPFEMTGEEFMQFAEKYDAAIIHSRPEKSKSEIQHFLALDASSKHFTQR